jgi:hypothetical protein
VIVPLILEDKKQRLKLGGGKASQTQHLSGIFLNLGVVHIDEILCKDMEKNAIDKYSE